jgi:hypothetical protein
MAPDRQSSSTILSTSDRPMPLMSINVSIGVIPSIIDKMKPAW